MHCLRQPLILYATTVLYSPSSSVAWVSEFATNLGRAVTNFRVGDGNARRSGPALCCAAPGAAWARCDWEVISASPGSPSVCRLQMGSAFGLRCQVSRHPGQQTDGGDSRSRSWRGQEVVSKHLSPRNRQARPDWLHGSPAGREKGQQQRRGDRLCSPSSHLPHSQKHFAIFMQLGAFPSFCPCAWGAKIQLSFPCWALPGQLSTTLHQVWDTRRCERVLTGQEKALDGHAVSVPEQLKGEKDQFSTRRISLLFQKSI